MSMVNTKQITHNHPSVHNSVHAEMVLTTTISSRCEVLFTNIKGKSEWCGITVSL